MKHEISDENGVLEAGDNKFYYGNQTADNEFAFKFSYDDALVVTYPFSTLGTDDEGNIAENLLAGIGRAIEEGYV